MAFFLDEYKIYDLTMEVAHDCPVWPSAALQDVRIEHDQRRAKAYANADKVTMSCHAGTHLDGPWHFIPRWQSQTINEIEIEGQLVAEGVIVDISDMVEDYGFYGQKEIQKAGVEIKKGDVLIINTGYHKYQPGQPYTDEIAYFYRHPGPKEDFADWCLEMEFKYLGIDAGSQDHPFGGALQERLPLETEAFCEKYGVKSPKEIFPLKKWFPMHKKLFPKGIIHVENIGGDIDKVKNKRCVIGTFPLKLVAESAPCRMVAFVKNET